MDKGLRIALYMRLSKEDKESGEESESIRTQRILLHRFVEEHFTGYSVTEFQDDGYSGTNLRRPGITEMLNLVKESAVDCIIVKDFSRFSRDYIELGSYLEQIFPFMGVRFISVNDNYDSEKCGGRVGELDMSFRNLLYDLYSKDLSVKVKSSLASGKERGLFISASCPFGYEKAPGDRHRLVVEEDEAEIVRRIFRMTMEGMTSTQIARTLNREGVKTPIEYKMEKGKTSRKAKGDRFAWSGGTICAILRNEAYTGDMVYGKTYKEQVGDRSHVRPRSEWKVFRNHHPPIISREIFDEIQKGRGRGQAPDRGGRHPLSGRLVCGCCGRNLYLRKGRNPFFCCPSLYVNPMESCVRKLNAMFLEQYVLYEIQGHLENLSDWEKSKLWEERRRSLGQRREDLKEEKRTLQSRLRSLKIQKTDTYEQYVRVKCAGRPDGETDHKTTYKPMQTAHEPAHETSKALQESLYAINIRTAETMSRLSETEDSLKSIERELAAEENMEELGVFFGLSELNRETVERFIRQIVVKDERHIKICWKSG